MLVEELLAAWPQTAAVFFRHRMACVGCAMSRFESVTEVAEVYGLVPERFLSELDAAIANP
jgi:hybrid cluster-associated redox disulfide protein